MSEPLAPLTRDVGCRRDMMWATRLAPSVSMDTFLAAVESSGFELGPGGIADRLVVYDHLASDHRLVYVVRTRRI